MGGGEARVAARAQGQSWLRPLCTARPQRSATQRDGSGRYAVTEAVAGAEGEAGVSAAQRAQSARAEELARRFAAGEAAWVADASAPEWKEGPDVLRALGQSLEGALRDATTSGSPLPAAAASSALVRGLFERGHLDASGRAFRALYLAGAPLRGDAFEAAIALASRRGHARRATALLADMSHRGLEPSLGTLARVGRVCAEHGLPQQAQAAWSHAKHLAGLLAPGAGRAGTAVEEHAATGGAPILSGPALASAAASRPLPRTAFRDLDACLAAAVDAAESAGDAVATRTLAFEVDALLEAWLAHQRAWWAQSTPGHPTASLAAAGDVGYPHFPDLTSASRRLLGVRALPHSTRASLVARNALGEWRQCLALFSTIARARGAVLPPPLAAYAPPEAMEGELPPGLLPLGALEARAAEVAATDEGQALSPTLAAWAARRRDLPPGALPLSDLAHGAEWACVSAADVLVAIGAAGGCRDATLVEALASTFATACVSSRGRATAEILALVHARAESGGASRLRAAAEGDPSRWRARVAEDAQLRALGAVRTASRVVPYLADAAAALRLLALARTVAPALVSAADAQPLVACHARGGQWREATEVLHTMREEWDIHPDAGCVAAALAACSRAAQPRQALRLLQLSREWGLPRGLNAFELAMAAAARGGDADAATRVIGSAVADARREAAPGADLAPRQALSPEGLGRLAALAARACEASGAWERAWAVLDLCVEGKQEAAVARLRGGSPSPTACLIEPTEGLFLHTAQACAEAGEWGRARRALRSMRRDFGVAPTAASPYLLLARAAERAEWRMSRQWQVLYAHQQADEIAHEQARKEKEWAVQRAEWRAYGLRVKARNLTARAEGPDAPPGAVAEAQRATEEAEAAVGEAERVRASAEGEWEAEEAAWRAEGLHVPFDEFERTRKREAREGSAPGEWSEGEWTELSEDVGAAKERAVRAAEAAEEAEEEAEMRALLGGGGLDAHAEERLQALAAEVGAVDDAGEGQGAVDAAGGEGREGPRPLRVAETPWPEDAGDGSRVRHPAELFTPEGEFNFARARRIKLSPKDQARYEKLKAYMEEEVRRAGDWELLQTARARAREVEQEQRRREEEQGYPLVGVPPNAFEQTPFEFVDGEGVRRTMGEKMVRAEQIREQMTQAAAALGGEMAVEEEEEVRGAQRGNPHGWADPLAPAPGAGDAVGDASDADPVPDTPRARREEMATVGLRMRALAGLRRTIRGLMREFPEVAEAEARRTARDHRAAGQGAEEPAHLPVPDATSFGGGAAGLSVSADHVHPVSELLDASEEEVDGEEREAGRGEQGAAGASHFARAPLQHSGAAAGTDGSSPSPPTAGDGEGLSLIERYGMAGSHGRGHRPGHGPKAAHGRGKAFRGRGKPGRRNPQSK